MSDMPSVPEPAVGAQAPAACLPVSASTGSVNTADSSTTTSVMSSTPVSLTISSAPQVAIATTVAQPIAAAQTTPVTIATTLTQLVASTGQLQPSQTQAPTAGAVIRSSLPAGTVQLIQQATPFVQQQYMQQQQYYIQSVQAMQGQPVAQQVNITPVQGRPPSTGTTGQKSPIISVAQNVSHGTVTLKSVAPSVTTVAGTQTAKGGGKTVVQQQAMISKQILSRPGQPLVIPVGQLGVLSNAAGNQTLVAQPKSPSVSLGSQTVINSPTQIRFTTAPTFMTSQGQILSGTVSPAVLNQIQMATIQPNTLPLGTQQVLGNQSAIIGTQPLYLRPTGIQTQQGIVQAVLPNKIRQSTDTGTVQMKSTGTQVKTVTPAQVKGVPNILPQTARPVSQVQGSPTLAKGVQTPQIKQVSRVRALKPQVKATVAQVVPGQPAKIAPQVTTTRLLTPAITRPPTVLVQPKPQTPQVTPKPLTTPTPTTASQVVTLVTTVPIATVANTQTQVQSTTVPVVTTPSPIKTAPPTTPVAPTIVSPIKAEPQPAPPTPPPTLKPETTDPGPVEIDLDKIPKPEEPMETDPPVTTVTAPGMVGAGAGPDKPTNKDTDHPLPPGPPLPLRPSGGDRNDRIATVIGERQAAIVKPNVLTHVIEGFVIQEAPEPFPVQRCSALSDFIPGRSSEQENDSAAEKDFSDSSGSSSVDSKDKDSEPSKVSDSGLKLKCEFCGKVDNAKRFRHSGRFCSRSCAKRYNVGCSRRIGQFQPRKRALQTVTGARRQKVLSMKKIWKRGKGGRVSTGPIQRNPEAPTLTSALTMSNVRTHSSSVDASVDMEEHGIGMSGLGAPSTISMETTTTTTTSSESERSTSPSAQDESSSPRSPPELEPEMDLETMGSCTPRRHLSKWTVQEVVDFVRNLPGCSMYADEFNRQEIDGQALMLLKEDHLMTTMSIKLGPALKICNKINSLKDEGH